jgi:hypothetical protein
MLTTIWHLLCDPDARYHDLGPGYYESKISNSADNVTSSASSNTSPAAESSSNPDPSYRQLPDRDRHQTRASQPDPAPLTLRRVLSPAHSRSDFRVSREDVLR